MAAAGSVLNKVFEAVAVVRRAKPLHPRGVLLDATVYRTGAPVRRNLSRAFYSSLFPYAAARGPVLLAAMPVQTASREVPEIPRHPSSAPLEFRLLAAGPRGHWQDYGLLRLTARDEADPDPPVSFDPVLNPLPGLRYYAPLAQLREPAYAGARRRTARGDPRPADLGAVEE